VEVVSCSRRGRVAPEGIDEYVLRDSSVRVYKEQTQKRSALFSPDRNVVAVVRDLERPQYPKVHDFS
jgi:hypothetical protein